MALSLIHEQKSRHLVVTMRDQISVRPGRSTMEKGKNVLACWKKCTMCWTTECVTVVQKGGKRFHWYESAEVTYYYSVGVVVRQPVQPFFFDHGQEISNSIRPGPHAPVSTPWRRRWVSKYSTWRNCNCYETPCMWVLRAKKPWSLWPR